MSLTISTFLNMAKNYKKANPNADEFDFLNSGNYYKSLDEHDRRFALKKLIEQYEPNVPKQYRRTGDELQCNEILK